MQTQSKFRLLVVRLGAMGDILHALPAVTALRQAHPGWVIDWVVEPKWSALLSAEGRSRRDTGDPRAQRPLIDRLYPAPMKALGAKPLSAQTRREFRSAAACAARNRSTTLSLISRARCVPRLVARFAGSRRVIGEAIPRERAARWLFTERVATQGAHVIEQDIELASAVAGDALEFTLPTGCHVDPAAEAWAERLIGDSRASL